MYRKLKITPTFSRRKTAVGAGLSVIEVVIASALLIVAMVPVLKGLTIAHASTTRIEHKTRSLMLAQSKLDDIRARSIYDFTNGGDSFAQSNTPLDGLYLCIVDDTGDPLKTISVSVGYDADGNGSLGSDEVEVTLTTLLARRWPD